MPPFDHSGQTLGEDLGSWTPPPFPPWEALTGSLVTLEPLDTEAHGSGLFDSFSVAPDSTWTYMTFGPFMDEHDLKTTLRWMVDQPDWLPYAIVVDGEPRGFAAYLRIDPPNGVIEVGSVSFSPTLQQTAAATEALFLLISNGFDLGYRRVEWKCDSLNEPSRRAGIRLGFAYEGTFKKATHYKGRNRDTAWFSMTDDEWSAIATAIRSWLEPTNFDESGTQLAALEAAQVRPGR